jgi:hypothetical protein
MIDVLWYSESVAENVGQRSVEIAAICTCSPQLDMRLRQNLVFSNVASEMKMGDGFDCNTLCVPPDTIIEACKRRI